MAHYIYFDGNEGDEKGRYQLGIPGSLEDIARLGDKIRVGQSVKLLEADGDFEIDAILERDAAGPWKGQWMGAPVGEYRPLLPAYGIRQEQYPEILECVRSSDRDRLFDLIQKDSQKFAPWTETPWWMGRSLLGEVFDVLSKSGCSMPACHALGVHGRLLLVERVPARVLSTAIAEFLQKHPEEVFTQSRYQGMPDAGRLAAEYLRGACDMTQDYPATAVFLG
jgi:hypothetical protein